ncbi:MAG: hypothetical protein RBQ78_06605 [Acholeplasmataceae bacterium]|jgi:alanine dehydrogenase|nr:hypothetical protein [Acholeplasmataceae bacterium]
MIVGTVKEVKNNEFRIGLTPSSVREYVHHSHQVLVESNAGLGAGFTDVEYQAAGAEIVNKAADVWKRSDMIVKVKEPLESEFGYLREGLLLYTYLHLAANEALTHTLIESKTQAVAYETIMLPDGSLPCLKPMSEVAGRLSVIEGAKHLEKPFAEVVCSFLVFQVFLVLKQQLSVQVLLVKMHLKCLLVWVLMSQC